MNMMKHWVAGNWLQGLDGKFCMMSGICVLQWRGSEEQRGPLSLPWWRTLVAIETRVRYIGVQVKECNGKVTTHKSSHEHRQQHTTRSFIGWPFQHFHKLQNTFFGRGKCCFQDLTSNWGWKAFFPLTWQNTDLHWLHWLCSVSLKYYSVSNSSLKDNSNLFLLVAYYL